MTTESEKSPRIQAKDFALRRLDRRECSSQDVLRFLIKKKIPADIASEVVSELKDLNLISDERFAKLLSREQAVRGKGPHVIRQKLREKGIGLNLEETKSLTEEVTQTTELDAAKELVRRKFPNAPFNNKASTNKKEALRALQTLLRRGFSYSVAREALDCPESD